MSQDSSEYEARVVFPNDGSTNDYYSEPLPVRHGEKLTIVDDGDDGVWRYCRNQSDQEGYVLASHLQHTSLSSPSSSEHGRSDSGTDADTAESEYDEGKTRYYRVLCSYHDQSAKSLMVEAGEKVKKVNAIFRDPNGRVFVENLLTGCRGFVPKSNIELIDKLDPYPWYLGAISRPDTEELLMEQSVPPGTFIVRKCQTSDGYGLAYKTDGYSVRVCNRRIKKSNGLYSTWSGYCYRSVPELVETHCSRRGAHKLRMPYDKEKMNSAMQSKFSLPKNRSLNQPVVNNRQQQRIMSTKEPPTPQRSLPLQQSPPDLSPYMRQQNMTPANDTNYYGDYKRTAAYLYAPGPQVASQYQAYYQSPQVAPQPIIPPRTTGPTQSPPPLAPRTPDKILTENSSSFASTSGSSTGAPAPLDAAPAPIMQGDKWSVSPARVEKLGKLGAGHYGEVFKAKFRKTNELLAMKTLNPVTMQVQDFKNETNTMKDLRHPYLVKLIGVCSDDHQTFMLMEFYGNGSIIDYFKKGNTLSEKLKLGIISHVAEGMAYLSSMNYIHRDLAARNVLLADDLSPRIADFGLARLIKGGNEEGSDMKMPWKWTAPEALCGRKDWSTKCDVWSYGVFCWELYTNCKERLYKDVSRSTELVEKLKTGYRLERPCECPKNIYELLENCWRLKPDKRISFADIENNLLDKNRRG